MSSSFAALALEPAWSSIDYAPAYDYDRGRLEVLRMGHLGGVRYVSGLHKGTDGAVGTPQSTEGYTLVDGIVSYAVTDKITLRANGTNLFNKSYIAAINKSGYRYTPGTPRTVLFSADLSF